MPIARKLIITILVIVGVLAWAWFGMGDVALWTLIVGMIFWIGLPALILLLFVGLSRLRHGDFTSLQYAGWLAGTMSLFLFAQELGVKVCVWEVKRAREFVSVALPAIEAFRSKESRYPESLAEAGVTQTKPRLFRYVRYSTDTFNLFYGEPTKLLNCWQYDVATKTWIELD